MRYDGVLYDEDRGRDVSTAFRSTASVRRLDVRTWALARVPRVLLAVIVVTEIIPVVWVGLTFDLSAHSRHSLLLATYLAVIALVFEECVTRASRLQLRLGPTLKRDMTSVWAVTGAVALTPVAGALLLVVVHAYVWHRQHRPAGEQAYRKAFNCANNVSSCMTASVVAAATSSSLSGVLPGALPHSLAVCAAIVAYAVVNRSIITVAFLSIGTPARDLMGSRDDNLIELATLCLGGLVAVTVIVEPILAILVLAPMVTLQRGAAMRALETAATTDSKTGLLNAIAWEEIAAREIGRAAREGADITVLIIDIDHFKQVNDRFGHLVGDSALRLIGRILESEVREYDTVARFGGEEFVAVLPSASTSEGLLIAERLRSRVNELTMSTIVEQLDPALDLRLAVSIGVATAPLDGVELPDLLHAADAALYRAKDEGRNRVVLADRGNSGELQTLPFA